MFTKMNAHNRFWFVTNLLAWLACAWFLYPFPNFDIENEFVDLVRWTIYLIIFVLGTISTLILRRTSSKLAYMLLVISVALFLLIRTFGFELPVYAGLVNKMLGNAGEALTWELIFTGGLGLWGGFLTAVYAFFVPVTLISSLWINLKLIINAKK